MADLLDTSARLRAPRATLLPRSNSFNFVPRWDVPRAAGAVCPLRDDARAFDPRRSLFLRLRDRMRLFETQTEDFSEGEIAATRAHEQLYADVSRKLMLDDFERDLRKLEPTAECADCPKQGRHCGKAWQASPTNVFGEARERLEAIIANLSGPILDVGCGEGPYLHALARRVRDGHAEYTGVDPDAARVELLRSRHPWARYVLGDLDDFASVRARAPVRFAHVLFLRSYNHLPDPARTLEVALSLLAPGGTLLVVDNVAFGLLRDARHAERAERGPGGFEHFRNDGLDELEALLRRSGLQPIERRSVTVAGCNEWLGHYRNAEKSNDR